MQRTDPLIGTTLDNTYRVTHLLQRGPVQTLYHALHLRLNRVVTVVLLEPTSQGLDYVKRHFDKAADLAATIVHPNIAQILDVGSSRCGPYFVLETLQGCSLDEHLQRHGPMAPSQATSLTLQLASALDFLHHQGLEVPRVDATIVYASIKESSLGVKLVNLPKLEARIDHHSDAPMSVAAHRFARGRTAVATRDDQFFLAAMTCRALGGRPVHDRDWADRPAPRAAHLLPLEVYAELPRTCAVLDRALGSSAEGRFDTSMQFAIRLLEASKQDALEPSATLDLQKTPSPRNSAESKAAETLMDLSACLEQDALTVTLRLADGKDESSATSADEAFVVSRIGAGCTFSALLDATAMPKEVALRTVSALLLRGVLEAAFDPS